VYYATTFPTVENPLSEGGSWILGGTTGLDWTNPRVDSAGFCRGLQMTGFDDSIAIATGTWPDNQHAEIVVVDNNPGAISEIEVLLRFSITANSAAGYECLFDVAGSCDLVRWNGALGDFTVLASASMTALATGNVLRAEVVGTVIRMYRNGTLLLTYDTVSDTPKYSSGKPGIGFYCDGGTETAFGISSFTAGEAATITGTATASITEADIVAGGKTVIATLTDDTYVSGSLVAPVIEAADITGSGNNTAETSPDIAYPAHNAGDLLIQVLVSDADAAHTAKPTGPNGEATTSIVFNSDPGVNGPHLSVMWWIASANTGAGSLIWAIDSEQWDGQTIRVPAGEFDPDDVIEAISSVGSSDTDSAVATMPSFVVTKADCRVICVGGVDADPMDAAYAPTGWTGRYNNDRGAVSSFCATRDAATTASETVAAADFGINPTDSYSCIGFAINAPPTSPFEDARQAFIDGMDSAQSEGTGWDAEVKANLAVTTVVRTSDTVVTVTLSAQAGYDITAQETITVTVPASILTGASPIVATPTFTIDTAAVGAARKDLLLLGVGQ